MGFFGDLFGETEADREKKRKAAEQQERLREAGTVEGTDELRDEARSGLEGVKGRQAPQAGRITVGDVRTGIATDLDTARSDQFRRQQLGLAEALGLTARGEGPFQSDIAARAASERNLRSQQAMLAGARGPQAAARARMAQQGVSGFEQQGAAQQVQGRLQEQAAARGQLAGVLAGARGADIGLEQQKAQLQQQMNLANLSAQNQQIFQQAGLDQATSLANMNAKLQTMGMNDQARINYISQLLGISTAEASTRLQAEIAASGVQTNIPDSGLSWGQAFEVGAPIVASAISDIRLKEDIKGNEDSLSELLRNTNPYEYDYSDKAKAKGAPSGRQIGVMAQDLEKSDIGAKFVEEDTDGDKSVNYGKGLSTMMAALSMHQKKIDELEKKLKGE